MQAGDAGAAGFDAKAFDEKMKKFLETNEDNFMTDWNESFETFDEMGLNEKLLRGIYAYGERKWGCGQSPHSAAMRANKDLNWLI